MADSRTPAKADPSPPEEQTHRRVGVAFSGGRDSTALLWASLQVAKPLGIEVVACHVHHGLMPQADQWWAHGEQQCLAWASQGWPVRFLGARLTHAPRPGDSVEAWARSARYEALAEMARQEGLSLMLLGHHQQDQAETLLIQLLRGAGPAGLSAMPDIREAAGVSWARPWLQASAQRVQAYAEAQGLAWVEDPSNQDPRFVRNRIRHRVLPALQASFAHVMTGLSRSAMALAEAQAVLSELAQADLTAVQWPGQDDRLQLSALAGLSSPRRKQVLRQWARTLPCGHFPESLVWRLDQAVASGAGGARRWPAPGHSEVTAYRGALSWQSQVRSPDARVVSAKRSQAEVAVFEVEGAETTVCLAEPGEYQWAGWSGRCRVEVAPWPDQPAAGIVSAACLASVTVRARQASDRFQWQAHGLPRSLKKCFQAAGVPSWARDTPVLALASGLLFVPGLGVDARWRVGMSSQAGGECRRLTWLFTPEDDTPGERSGAGRSRS